MSAVKSVATFRRSILIGVAGLVTTVVVLAIVLSVATGRPASAASASSIVVAHINGVTGGQERTGVACAVSGDSNAGNIFQVATVEWGLTQIDASTGASGGAGAGKIKVGSVVFSANTGWDTPQLETLLAQNKTTAASFCVYQASGAKSPTLLETYDFTTCFVAGVNSSVTGSSVTASDEVTLNCAALTHTVFLPGGKSQAFTYNLLG